MGKSKRKGKKPKEEVAPPPVAASAPAVPATTPGPSSAPTLPLVQAQPSHRETHGEAEKPKAHLPEEKRQATPDLPAEKYESMERPGAKYAMSAAAEGRGRGRGRGRGGEDEGPRGRGHGGEGSRGRGRGDEGSRGRGRGDEGSRGRGRGDEGSRGRGRGASEERDVGRGFAAPVQYFPPAASAFPPSATAVPMQQPLTEVPKPQAEVPKPQQPVRQKPIEVSRQPQPVRQTSVEVPTQPQPVRQAPVDVQRQTPAVRETPTEVPRQPQSSPQKSGAVPKQQQPRAPSQGAQASPPKAPQKPFDMKSLDIQLKKPPGKDPIPRPNFGKAGRPIKLRANFFPLKIKGDVTIYHYDVDVKPEIRNKAKMREIVHTFIRQSPQVFKGVFPVFDGKKNMYMHRELRFNGPKFEMDVKLDGDGERARPMHVAIQYAASIPLYSLVEFLEGRTRENPQDAIQALDIVFREMPNSRFIPLTQYFFTHAGDQAGIGLEFWNGYYQSVRPTAWKTVMLQVDSSVRVFHKGQHVITLLEEVLGRRVSPTDPPLDRDRERFRDHIKGLAVEIDTARYPMLTKRTYKLIGLSDKPASQQLFPMSQPTGPDIPCKVADYFFSQYKLKLQFPNLHCLQAQPKEKHRYIPMEMCVVKKGQQLKKLSEELTSQLIRYSAKPAPQREFDINKIMSQLNFQVDPITSAYGMSISKNMVEFTGRVLNAPEIEYSSNKKVRVMEGAWNMRNQKFYSGANVKAVAVLCFDYRTREDVLWNFCSELSRAAAEAGMSLPSEPCMVEKLRHPKDVAPAMLRAHRLAVQLIIVVLAQKSNDIYGEVKRVGDLEIGVATQCVQSKNVNRISVQTLANICQKINAKLGEVNAVIPSQTLSPIMKEAVIIMGADVTHPAPGDDTKPSIAAVTGSYDKQAFKYAARISMQKHRQEIIEDLKDITMQLLRNFREKLRGTAPKRIIFYRDGVSEGQFRDVLASELQAIQQACFSLSPTYKPLITFIVVQKRHHTRLFCQEKKDQVGRSGNVPAGTTVDTDIVHPLEFDFYLCSHNGIQGTSRPAHYYVLYDDSNFTADSIQQFTYQLCHVYARCTRSVSIPAPAYYAHHCAFRGRFYLDRQEDHGDIPPGDRDAPDVLRAMNEKCLLHADYKGMFFA